MYILIKEQSATLYVFQQNISSITSDTVLFIIHKDAVKCFAGADLMLQIVLHWNHLSQLDLRVSTDILRQDLLDCL